VVSDEPEILEVDDFIVDELDAEQEDVTSGDRFTRILEPS
jgi:hypothetical protein